MKRISIILLVVFAGVANALAQVDPAATINYQSLESKLARSDKSLTNPEKANLYKTWLDRAKVFEEIADVHSQYLRFGMKNTEVKLYLKEPKEIKSYSDKEEYIYDRITLTFESGNLKYWEETKPVAPNAIEEAIKAYKKTIELDTEGKATKKISEGLKNIRSIVGKLALGYYNQKNNEMSFSSFKTYTDLGELKEVNSIDTIYVFYTGVTAFSAKKYPEAIEYLNKAVKIGYNDPMLYTTLKTSYYITGDTAKGFEILQKGVELYPDNQDILIELVNHYLSKNESKLALDYLIKAKEKDPKNKSFYFAEGNLYEKVGNQPKAVEVYLDAIKLDSSYFDAYYNIGVIYFNNGVKLTDLANNEVDNKKFAEKKKIADDEFRKVIPYMEKAYEIVENAPTSDNMDTNKANLNNRRQTLETLKSLYYRLKIMDKFEKVDKLLKEI